MTESAQLLLRSCSVAIFGLVNAAAVTMGPAGQARPMLLFCGLLAVAAALQSMVWEAEGLGAAMLLSLPPLLALGGGAESWLIGPLGALLLLASELNAASWEFRGGDSTGVLARRRVASAAQLSAAGSAASVVVVGAAGLGPSLGGTAAVVVAAAALAGLASLFFGRTS